MDGYDDATYGDRFADVYDDWYDDPAGTDRAVATLYDLAAGGPVLELGVGTGRLALPLADEKDEGGQAAGWSLPAKPQAIDMPPNALFDGGVFRCGS